MKTDCEVIRDLLPLYADEACSGKSRELVNEHLLDCAGCREMLHRLQENEIEKDLIAEKEEVIEYGTRKFRRRSAQVGSVISGIFAVPILVCLIINLYAGAPMGWFFILLAAMGMAASLVIVPLMMPEDKLFWTFCAFTASLVVLLAVICFLSGGTWFFIAASASLFGLSAVFLPFVIRAAPAKKLIGNANRTLVVLGVDALLFLIMMTAIFSHGVFKNSTNLFAVACIAAVGLVAAEILRKREE